jgi:AraC-like DNA-binding protein
MMCVVNMRADAKHAASRPACTPLRSGHDVAVWRTSGDSSLLWMRGRTKTYTFDPIGEYVIGVAGGNGYLLRRGGATTHRVEPGDLVVLDPSARHEGTTNDGGTWPGRLLIIELSRLNANLDSRVDVEFDIPILRDPVLSRRFINLHRLSQWSRPCLELDVELQQLIEDVANRSGSARARARIGESTGRVRLALDRINSDPAGVTTLDELAELTGMSRYALVRRFKSEVGLPPHTYQIALRLQLARRLIERGTRPADAAAEAGFTDQSHLHRHFRRMGMTPGAYAAAIERGRGR